MPIGAKYLAWIGVAAALAAGSPGNGDAQTDMKTLARDNAAFAFDLYEELREQEGNLFFSPHSISTALAMTLAGAREETRAQMEQTLRLSLDPPKLHQAFSALESRLNAIQNSGAIQLQTANSLWPQADALLSDFLALIETYYNAAVEPVDYTDDSRREQARKRINDWVAARTADKIRDLIPDGVLDSLTRLVLVNAIYFKGDWAFPFKETATTDAPFHPAPGKAVSAPFMQQQERFGYAETDDLQLLELPYGDGALSMLVALPKAGDGLQKLEGGLSADRLQDWRGRLRREKVEVHLPRFKIESGFRLNSALQDMGMTDAFNPDKANFAGMDGNPNWLYITAALHKAFVEVNESGTEAAAATAVVVGARSIAMPAPVPVFRADHPFLFLIQEKETGAVLFMGRVVDPTDGGA